MSNKTGNYHTTGMFLPLPITHNPSNVPEWRMAMFSIVMPFPESGLPHELRQDRFIELTGKWQRGRFKGVRGIEAHGAKNGRAPEAYHHQARHRYGNSGENAADNRRSEPLSDSIGAAEVDLGPGESHSGSAVRCYRRMFRPDVFNGADQGEAVTASDAQTCYHVLDDEDHPDATMELVGIEFLQYRDITMRDPDAASNIREHGYDYLVLHVIAENCSSEMLEQVSLGLHKPRAAVGVKSSKKPIRPLRTLIDISMSELNEGLPREVSDRFNIRLTPGGYMFGSGCYVDPSQGSVTRAPGGNPFRAVCAIHGKSPETGPAIFDDAPALQDRGNLPQQYCNEDLWAWSLSSGVDNFAAGIPDPAVFADDPYSFGDFLHWTTATSAAGFAIVRRSPASREDPRFWMLTSTRLLDLALLVHRSYDYLGHINRRLRNVNFQDLWTSDTGKYGEHYEKNLNESLMDFKGIQADLVWFRDRMWFEAEPKRVTDTWFMRSFRAALGAQERYDDILAEMELRKNVYGTLYDSVQAKRDRERAKQNEFQNWLLGAIAIVVTVPDLVVFTSNGTLAQDWPILLGWLVGLGVIMAVILLFQRRR